MLSQLTAGSHQRCVGQWWFAHHGSGTAGWDASACEPARLIVTFPNPLAGLCCILSLMLSPFAPCTPHIFSSLVFLVIFFFISWNLPLKLFCIFSIMYLPAWLTLLCSIESTSGIHQVIVKTLVCIPLSECVSCHTFKQLCWFWWREFNFFLKVKTNQYKNSKQSFQQWAIRIYVLIVHGSEDVMIQFSWASTRSKDFVEM